MSRRPRASGPEISFALQKQPPFATQANARVHEAHEGSTASTQSCVTLNVSHDLVLPDSSPRLNQRTRCSELPCVKDSGET